MPKSTQTRFVGIRDLHAQPLYILCLLFSIITDLLNQISTCYILGVFLTCMTLWEKFMLSPVSHCSVALLIISLLIINFYDPHATQKASIGMYNGSALIMSYPYKSCLCTCVRTLP